MTEFTKKNVAFLAALLTICAIMACSAKSVQKFVTTDVVISQEAHSGVENGDASVLLGNGNDGPEVMGQKRLSQLVTVTTNDGTVPVSGRVVKSKDDFYPGTYELTFANNAILSSHATVEVRIDAAPGDVVHVLTGDKDSGYKEYTTVEVDKPGVVAFDTNILQSYTLSTTDIKGAQEAMADILSSTEAY